jgi:hypothetical protein
MVNKKISKWMISTLLIFTLENCFWEKSNSKPESFYDYSQTWDLWRIPLIQPFQVISSDRGYFWGFDNTEKNQISADSIGVQDSTIVVFSQSLYIPKEGGQFKAWTIIDKRTGQEDVFLSYKDYKRNLVKKNITSIILHKPSDVFKEFDKRAVLPPTWPEQPKIKR